MIDVSSIFQTYKVCMFSIKFPRNFRVLEVQFISVRFPTVVIPLRLISAEHRITEISDLRNALIQTLQLYSRPVSRVRKTMGGLLSVLVARVQLHALGSGCQFSRV